jgi:fermentation-respiration switch protein FrsA (DUF1100 family)
LSRGKSVAVVLRPLVLRFLLVVVLPLTSGCSRLVDGFLYFPDRSLVATPGSVGLSYEDVRFSAEDETELHGWWIPGRRPGPCVVFFHGNAGDIADRVEMVRNLHNRVGFDVFLFDYRGYGESLSSPSEEGLYADARGARAVVRARGWDRDGLLLYGRSLGAAVALHSAAEDPVSGLVLEAPFTTLMDAARFHYPVLSHLVTPWLRDRYDNVSKIRAVTCPVLFIHGDRDPVAPIAMGWQLFDAAAGPKWFRTVPGSGHNDLASAGGDAYWESWARLLREIGAQQTGPGLEASDSQSE